MHGAWAYSGKLCAFKALQQRSFASNSRSSTESSSGGSSGSSDSSVDSAGADASKPPRRVHKRRGKAVQVLAELEAKLAPLAKQCGCSSTALSTAVARL